MNKVYIVSGKRTPIGSLLGSLSKVQGVELMATALKGAYSGINVDPNLIDELIVGNVISAGQGQNPARQVSILSNINKLAPCSLVNKVCASGLKSLLFAHDSIKVNRNNLVACGGYESMSNAPFIIQNMRRGIPFGTQGLLDSLAYDGLTDKYNNIAMGLCGEKTAEEMGITREVQDEYAIESYNRTIKSQETGLFDYEITPVSIQVSKDKSQEIKEDEEPKKFNPEKMPLLRPAFSKTGTITAANASKINDGACALLVASEAFVKQHRLTPLAEVVSFGEYETDPMDFNISPQFAAKKAIDNAGLKKSDIDFYEFNEAFSVTGLANIKLMDLDFERVNVHGGAVALGHPIGMSGSRIVLSLLNVLKRNDGKYGVASICNGGGGSTAVLIKNIN